MLVPLLDAVALLLDDVVVPVPSLPVVLASAPLLLLAVAAAPRSPPQRIETSAMATATRRTTGSRYHRRPAARGARGSQRSETPERAPASVALVRSLCPSDPIEERLMAGDFVGRNAVPELGRARHPRENPRIAWSWATGTATALAAASPVRGRPPK